MPQGNRTHIRHRLAFRYLSLTFPFKYQSGYSIAVAVEPGLQEYEDWLKGILRQAAQYGFDLVTFDIGTELKAVAAPEEAKCSDCGATFEMFLYDLCPKCVKRVDAMTPEELRELHTCPKCDGYMIHEDGCEELTASTEICQVCNQPISFNDHGLMSVDDGYVHHPTGEERTCFELLLDSYADLWARETEEPYLVNGEMWTPGVTRA